MDEKDKRTWLQGPVASYKLPHPEFGIDMRCPNCGGDIVLELSGPLASAFLNGEPVLTPCCDARLILARFNE